MDTAMRWIIGGVAIMIFTALEIHGSSIGMYAKILNHPELGDAILGGPRPIRSDEWAVFTPFAFSQYFTNFSMVSEIVRAAPTNMFMTYGQAVWHPAMIFRPAQIGYLFLDAGSALAFFWMGRLIVLFLISFEFARLILQVDRKMCVLYALMVAFSPFAQWWWSVSSVAEILAAGQGLVVYWKIYLDYAGERLRFVAAAGFLWCAGIFIFAIYPAWQVSFGYMFLFCLLAVTKLPALKILRRDKFFWLAGLVIMLAPICHALFVAQDMIRMQMATEYPGRRISLGGNFALVSLMTYGIDFILPFSDVGAPTNNCEAASFFSMMPLGFIMFAYVTIVRKRFDAVMVALCALSLLLMLWAMFGIPAWLARISLMSFVPTGRARAIIELAQLAMVFRGLSLTELKLARPIRVVLSVAIAALSTFFVYQFLPDWFVLRRSIPVLILTAAFVFVFISAEVRHRFAILFAMIVLMGATVNPVVSGVDSVYKIPVGQKISEIVQQEGGKANWLVVEAPIDFPIMFGAPTINSVNVYPNLERWRILDPEGRYASVYNRYAHIEINLRNEPTEFVLNAPDNFTVNLNLVDLPKLGVSYIFSRNGTLEQLSISKIKIAKIYEEAGSFVYRVTAVPS